MASWVWQRWIIFILLIPAILTWGHKKKHKKCPYHDDVTHECCTVKSVNITVPMHFIMKCSDVPTTTPAIEGPGNSDNNGETGGRRKKRSATNNEKSSALCLVEVMVTLNVVYGEIGCCDGWKRDIWQGTCYVDEPGPIICFNGGNVTEDKKSCVCKNGFHGVACEIPECDPPCLNQGECIANEGTPACACSGGRFTGKQCETPVCPVPCQNGGECQQVGFTAECVCSPDFEGPGCEHSIKAGACPVAKLDFANCYDSCQNDQQCSGLQKCCLNACGRSCQTSVSTECLYKGKTYQIGESFKDGNCKSCTCLHPGDDSVNCTVTTCPKSDCKKVVDSSGGCCPICKDHGEPTGTGPRFQSCPSNVTVYLQANSKTANLELSSNLQFIAVDSHAEEYQPQFSVSHLSTCACNDTRRNLKHVVATSENDRFGRFDMCTFSAKVVDPFSPKFQSCPSPAEVLWDENVIWNEPEVTDNVGIQSLTLITPRVNNSRFGIGEFVVIYIAKDYDGNEAVCRFTVKSFHPSSPYLPPHLLARSYKKADFTVIALVLVMIGGLVILSVVLATILRHCQKNRAAAESGTDDTELASSSPPPAYEHIVKDTLPEYSAQPPVYDQVDLVQKSSKAGVFNPIYNVADENEDFEVKKVPLEAMEDKE